MVSRERETLWEVSRWACVYDVLVGLLDLTVTQRVVSILHTKFTTHQHHPSTKHQQNRASAVSSCRPFSRSSAFQDLALSTREQYRTYRVIGYIAQRLARFSGSICPVLSPSPRTKKHQSLLACGRQQYFERDIRFAVTVQGWW